MLRHLIRATLIGALAFAWPAAASAQSLAELAKKTKKDEEKSSSETITAQELRRAGRSSRGNVSPPRSTTANPGDASTASEDGAEGGDAEGGGEEEKTPEQLREEARADWSQRLTAAEAEVTRLEARIAEIQQSLANPGVGSVEQRAERNANLETAQAELATARQSITTLQREGRQNGYRR